MEPEFFYDPDGVELARWFYDAGNHELFEGLITKNAKTKQVVDRGVRIVELGGVGGFQQDLEPFSCSVKEREGHLSLVDDIVCKGFEP